MDPWGARYSHARQSQEDRDRREAETGQHVSGEICHGTRSTRGQATARRFPRGKFNLTVRGGNVHQIDTLKESLAGEGVFRARGRSQRTRGDRLSQRRRVDEGIQADDESKNNWPELCARHCKLKQNLPDLPCFKADDDVFDAVMSKNVSRLKLLENLNDELDPRNYIEPLELLLAIEETHQAFEMRKFDMFNKLVDIENHCIDFPGLSNGQPSLVPGDMAIIHDGKFEIKEIFYITTTRGDKIILNERKVKEKAEILKQPRNITLVSSNTQFDTCRMALSKSSQPYIQEVITEASSRRFIYYSRILELEWNEEEFCERVNRLEIGSWLRSLFRTEMASEETSKVYIVNPAMWPFMRGEPYNPDASRPRSFTMECRGPRIEIGASLYVLFQSPSSLKTALIPARCDDSNEYSLDEQRCNAIREFFHENSHDVMFLSTAMVEAAKLTGHAVADVQPSLREIFHDGPEDLESKLACNTLKIDMSSKYESEFDLNARLKKLNKPQRQAVIAILEARCRPKPYILFGPPGTGKTHTLVEAVVQIYWRNSQARVLFCANSNTCADQIYEKLERTGMIDINGVERIRAGDRVAGLDFRRIIITTNIKSGSLVSQRASFDYVFLDEAGHAHEPESLIPICSMDQYDGCLVLAGDPKQLGPVVLNQKASDLGLGTSMLERIFKFEAYEKHKALDRYNRFYITKLLHCYRCDPSILEISNKLFYDNELIYVNETPKSLLRMLNLRKSVQFRHVNGHENKPEWSTSWRNHQEVDVCVDILSRLYKMGLEADQIGLITPYKLQSKEIVKRLKSVVSANSRLLNQRFPSKSATRRPVSVVLDPPDLADWLSKLSVGSHEVDGDKRDEMDSRHKIVWTDIKRDWMCKVDTVDAFQGNEREVIIISTVRTGMNRRLDFLNDARRFNVAVSRAKWLLIVVGDKNILSGDGYWSEIYKRAEKNDLVRWPRVSPSSEDPHSLRQPLFRS